MKLRILSTQTKSETAALLADTLSADLNYKVWRSEKIQSFAVHVQYGDPRTKDWQYEYMKKYGLPGPEFTSDIEDVEQWLLAGEIVIARKMVNSHDGGGIVVLQNDDEIPEAKVYTKYFPSTNEYRVMLFQDKVLAIYEKLRKYGFAKNILRTTSNGYILGHVKTPPPAGITGLSKMFCYMNRSDIKGIDIAVNGAGEMMVLEVNSAPEMGPKMCKMVSEVIQQTYAEELV